MEDHLTPEEAVRRAVWIIKIPSMAVLLLPLCAFIVCTRIGLIPDKGYAGMKWAVPTFLISFIGSWVVWSLQVPKWRLWAYRRVKNIRLLKQRAVEAGVIWNAGTIFEKTEIMSRATREELQRLDS